MARKSKTQVSELASLVAVAVAEPVVETKAATKRNANNVTPVTFGDKVPNLRSPKNQETWCRIVEVLQGGTATIQQLHAELKGHEDFIGYCLRSKWLAAAQ
jgi:hypothetical protein